MFVYDIWPLERDKTFTSQSRLITQFKEERGLLVIDPCTNDLFLGANLCLLSPLSVSRKPFHSVGKVFFPPSWERQDTPENFSGKLHAKNGNQVDFREKSMCEFR